MSGSVIYIIVIMAVIYAAIFYISAQRKKKLKGAFDNLDMRLESARAADYTRELLDKHYPYVRKQMKDAPVDAFTIANLEYTAKDQAKDIAKNALKGLATLGTVRFNTVQTPKFLVLSGEDLHLLDTDVDGDISKHLIFDNARLRHSTIQEVPLTKMENTQAKYLGNIPKRYVFSLETDGKNIDIMLFNTLMNTFADAAGKPFSTDTGLQVKRFVAGNYFLKKLGEKVPSLRTPTALP